MLFYFLCRFCSCARRLSQVERQKSLNNLRLWMKFPLCTGKMNWSQRPFHGLIFNYINNRFGPELVKISRSSWLCIMETISKEGEGGVKYIHSVVNGKPNIVRSSASVSSAMGMKRRTEPRIDTKTSFPRIAIGLIFSPRNPTSPTTISTPVRR